MTPPFHPYPVTLNIQGETLDPSEAVTCLGLTIGRKFNILPHMINYYLSSKVALALRGALKEYAHRYFMV